MLEPVATPPHPEPDPSVPPGRRPRAGWVRRAYLTLRTEHTTPGKLAIAVGLGVFLGCSPFWGLHFVLCLVAAAVFRLNRVLVYAAANLANPLTAPLIVFVEVQVGHRILENEWLGLSIGELTRSGLKVLFLDFLVGGLLVGAALGAVFGLAVWVIARLGPVLAPRHQELADALVRRYLDVSVRDAEGARSRLLRDPIYPFLLQEPGFLEAPRLLDLGCGRGLVAALLAEHPPGPGGRSYLGVDLSPRYVRAAREALGDRSGYRFVEADLRDFDPPAADLVLLLNVLRYLPVTGQDALLRRLGRALPPGARMLVREVDASGGWAFHVGAWREHLAFLLPHRPHSRFGYRRAEDLRNALIAAGFEVRDRSTLHRTSRARVLLEAVRRPGAVR